MEELYLGSLRIHLKREYDGVRVIGEHSEILLYEENIENIAGLLQENFECVHRFFFDRISAQAGDMSFLPEDIEIVSFKIVAHFLFMYNMWRNSYKRHANLDLRFKTEDFDNTTTRDTIIFFYQEKYPNDWEPKVRILLNMTLEKLKEYWEGRLFHFNR